MKRIIILVLLLILVGCSFTNVEETTTIKEINPTQDVNPSYDLFDNISNIKIFNGDNVNSDTYRTFIDDIRIIDSNKGANLSNGRFEGSA